MVKLILVASYEYSVEFPTGKELGHDNAYALLAQGDVSHQAILYLSFSIIHMFMYLPSSLWGLYVYQNFLFRQACVLVISRNCLPI